MVLGSTMWFSTRISHEAAAQLWVAMKSPWTFFTHLAGGSSQLDNLQVGFLHGLGFFTAEWLSTKNKWSERQLGRRCNSFNASGVPEYHFYCEVDTISVEQYLVKKACLGARKRDIDSASSTHGSGNVTFKEKHVGWEVLLQASMENKTFQVLW